MKYKTLVLIAFYAPARAGRACSVYPVRVSVCVCYQNRVRSITWLLGPRIEKCGCPIVITSSVRPSTLSLCCDNSNTFLPKTFKLCIWITYQIRRPPIVFGVITSKVKVAGNFFGVFYIPFSNATLCCDNWNTFLQGTFKLGQNVYLGKILVKFEYGSSGVCLSVRPSVCPHFLCAAITGILFYRELSNFVRMFLWTRS